VSEIVKVKVVVYEDGVEQRGLIVAYNPGQLYTVKIDTPDGTDRVYEGVTKATPTGGAS
jgi:hypothetical protein